jgi:hypothetical protein
MPYTRRKLTNEYSSLTSNLMTHLDNESPSERDLEDTDTILDKMIGLVQHASDIPRYFSVKTTQALVTLLRAGAKYLEDHEYYRLDRDIIGEEFAASVVRRTVKPKIPNLRFAF